MGRFAVAGSRKNAGVESSILDYGVNNPLRAGFLPENQRGWHESPRYIEE